MPCVHPGCRHHPEVGAETDHQIAHIALEALDDGERQDDQGHPGHALGDAHHRPGDAASRRIDGHPVPGIGRRGGARRHTLQSSRAVTAHMRVPSVFLFTLMTLAVALSPARTQVIPAAPDGLHPAGGTAPAWSATTAALAAPDGRTVHLGTRDRLGIDVVAAFGPERSAVTCPTGSKPTMAGTRAPASPSTTSTAHTRSHC